MRFLLFKPTSNHLLLFVFLNLLWAITDGTTTSTSKVTTLSSVDQKSASPTETTVTTTAQPTTTTPSRKKNDGSPTETTNETATTQSTATTTTPPTYPPDVYNVTVGAQNETSITLQWTRVDNILTYNLTYNNTETEINFTTNDSSVQYVVSDLTAGTKYDFTLFTVSNGTKSTGKLFPAATAPLNPANFSAVGQNETSITLEWTQVVGIQFYTLDISGFDNNIILSQDLQSYVVSDLNNTSTYSFTLFTVFENVSSSGIGLIAVTAPLNPANFRAVEQNETSITLEWTPVDGIQYYILDISGFDNNITLSNKPLSYVVSDLNNTSTYNFTLFTVFENVSSSGIDLVAVTAPLDPAEFRQEEQNETSVTLQWKRVTGIQNYILDVNGNESNVTLSDNENITHTITDLQSANMYNVTLFTAFEYARSRGNQLLAVTAPSNPAQFKASGQKESSITLEWTKQDKIHSYILKYGEKETNITSKDLETYTVSGLQSASEYSGETITAVAAPENPKEFSQIEQNEANIPLQRKQVKDIEKYKVHYDNNTKTVNATEGIISHTVGNLTHGAAYNFSLFALFENIRSSGVSITAFTVPPQVSLVNVTERNVTSATLKWKNPNRSWTYSFKTDGTDESVKPDNSDFVSFRISDLKPGTLYNYSVTTLFSGLSSPPYNGFLVTQIECEKINWQATTSSIQGTVEGVFTAANATNTSHTSQAQVGPGDRNVLFNGLYPGATYEISLVYKAFPQCATNPKVTIFPPLLSGSCKNWASGYSALIVWDKPEGVWTKVEVNMSGQSHLVNGNENQFTISGLQPAKAYKVSLVSLSGERSSSPFSFSCNTDSRGVVAGSVVGVLLFAVLVCMALFIFLKRPDIIRGKKSFIAGVEKPATKRKVIPKANFSDHFTQLSADENRGFSEEYEALAPVGTDQTRKAATLPENKSKNRFTNILPYDWSRVKLITSSPDVILDYINANYMPGYNRNREYIASQGPLPNTVKDFWRMIWEQRVKGIVMVTNCIESGRTKCERYWPEDRKPCPYGELLVTLTSEQQESNWTLREFTVKNRNDSEERTVKHFHFTAWPDHGVPLGTQILIQFRGLVRRHIESDGTKSPTVVHCSAGVGRTGTLIALDVLLQQLEKQQAVSINDFVHRMRQHRSHMVQTESQYVFLHQCIMDSLKLDEKQEENIYENSDLIYANATALREFHNHNT